MNIINITDHQPVDEIAVFSLFKCKDGTYGVRPTWADENFIASHSNLSERFLALKEMIVNGLPFLDECARDFDGKP